MRRRGLAVLCCFLAVLFAGCATGETGSPTNVTEDGATVGGRVVSSVAGPVEYWVQYGSTAAYGLETDHASVDLPANVSRLVTGIEVTGLSRATTYHYRLCARDSQQSGPGCGADRKVKTQSFACGETVVTSVRLTGSVSCFASPGLVVGASGIDVNLAGHHLAGLFGVGGSGTPAIVNNGHADVTIRNGALTGSNAIRLQGASRNSIRDVDATGGAPAILIQGGEANEVRASTATGRGPGVGVVDSDRALITGTRATRGSFGPGISVQGDLARITRNDLRLEDGRQSSNPAMVIQGSDNQVIDNQVGGHWQGGIVVSTGARNVIAENESSDIVDIWDPPIGDGILIGAGATGTLLRNNVTERNRGDGIEVQSPDARLRDNRANNNGGFGIDAAAGVTDLGGNTAFGNANPLQCRNVFCQ